MPVHFRVGILADAAGAVVGGFIMTAVSIDAST